jgi:hypothetical protein
MARSTCTKNELNLLFRISFNQDLLWLFRLCNTAQFDVLCYVYISIISIFDSLFLKEAANGYLALSIVPYIPPIKQASHPSPPPPFNHPTP